MKDYLGIDCKLQKGYEGNELANIAKGLKKDLYATLNKKWNYFISLSPALEYKRIIAYFTNYKNNFNLSCTLPWNAVGILPNGDVTFCDNFPDYILGNIKTEDLEKIWNNKKDDEVWKRYA